MGILSKIIPPKIGYIITGMLPAQRRHRRLMQEHYAPFIRPGDLVFDIGANNGDRTMVFRRLGARVIAVEPQEQCITHLQKLFSGDKNVTIIGEALSEMEGAGELSINDHMPVVSTMSQQWRDKGRFSQSSGWTRTQSVRTTTLDILLAKFGTPIFCKIDVEGYELSVLKGLSSPLHVVSFEFTNEFIGEAFACVNALSDLGTIEANYTIGESMDFSLSRWVDLSTLHDSMTSQKDPSLWGDIYVRFV